MYFGTLVFLRSVGGREAWSGVLTDVVFVAAPRWQERTNQAELSVEEMASRMLMVGSRVARGRDWVPGCTDDGTPPGHGTVLRSAKDSDHYVDVKWESGSSNQYYVRRNGNYPLKLLGIPIPSKVSASL